MPSRSAAAAELALFELNYVRQLRVRGGTMCMAERAQLVKARAQAQRKARDAGVSAAQAMVIRGAADAIVRAQLPRRCGSSRS